MSRFPNPRPKPKQPSPGGFQTRAEMAIQEAADEIYRQSGGDLIDGAIERAKRLLAIHDREAKELLANPKPGYRWTISPSIALQWQKELGRQHERQEQLKAECLNIARSLVEDHMRTQQRNHRHPAPQAQPQPRQPEEGRPADAKPAA